MTHFAGGVIQIAMSEKLDTLKTLLSVVKQASADKIEEQFYNLMCRAKNELGQTSYSMAYFYYEYANFIIEKLEKNLDIFNNQAVDQQVNHQDEALDNIPQVYQDSQQLIDDSSQSVQAQKAALQDANLNIPQNQDPNQAQASNQNEVAAQPEVQVDDDDKDIAICNLEFAITILENEMMKTFNGSADASVSEILDGLRRAKTRLGDVLMMEEEYVRAVEEYRKVIDQQKQRQGGQTSRLVAELHFLIGNCFLYDNKEGCEEVAIQEFVKAVVVLVNNLTFQQFYDTSSFQIPNSKSPKVDRFAYLAKPQDTDTVKDIKEVIICLLDKIEDTAEQVSVRKAYDQQKQKQKAQKDLLTFKPVDQTVKVVNLGTFGNRKKKIEQAAPVDEKQQ